MRRLILTVVAVIIFFGLPQVAATAQAEESVKVNGLWSGTWNIGRNHGDIEFQLVHSTKNTLNGTVTKLTGMHNHPMAKDLVGNVEGNRVEINSSDGHRIVAIVKGDVMSGTFYGHVKNGDIAVKRMR
jgi:hypothetical protein